ncbi:sulfatase [Streptomyces davaonensis JCM 4913]|uniref:Sulfatase n=1 Tax=Streptomyces davaonensis (strain DSM 101723 / JCM 4913 / KCC S-0913 / 768) TaxID=1214101 RepID=K4QU57_STRDJ|nr:sulfatase [Streptomyces davaonensis]CCK27471.1 sulfatase [Streptomyces davaonensis JCM 4913]
MAEGERRGRPARRALIAGGVVAAAGTAVPLVAGAVSSDSGPEPRTTRAARRTAAPAAATRRPRSDDRPNILLVLTDDQPKETEWALRHTVDWLGGSGVTFERAHANTPLCAPSRASVMTGRYAHRHGVLDTRHPYYLDQRTTVQRRLREAGYRTGLFGKYLNFWRTGDNPPHFDEWLLQEPVRYVDGHYNDNGAVRRIPGYNTTVIKDRALAFMEASRTDQRPWFAYVATRSAHEVNVPEPKYAHTRVPDWKGRPSVFETGKDDKPPFLRAAGHPFAAGRDLRARQLRTLLSVDDAMHDFREKLRALGQLENTLVVFTSDHGLCWGDHGWLRKSVPYRPSLEVPFHASWPAGGLGTSRADDRLTGLIDIAPTFLDAAGLPPDPEHDGHSLLDPGNDRPRLLAEWWWNQQDQRPIHSWASSIGKGDQYTEYFRIRLDHGGRPTMGDGKVLFREYYDLRADPFQLTNLLNGASAAQERRLGIPALARGLAAARGARTGSGVAQLLRPDLTG